MVPSIDACIALSHRLMNRLRTGPAIPADLIVGSHDRIAASNEPLVKAYALQCPKCGAGARVTADRAGLLFYTCDGCRIRGATSIHDTLHTPALKP